MKTSRASAGARSTPCTTDASSLQLRPALHTHHRPLHPLLRPARILAVTALGDPADVVVEGIVKDERPAGLPGARLARDPDARVARPRQLEPEVAALAPVVEAGVHRDVDARLQPRDARELDLRVGLRAQRVERLAERGVRAARRLVLALGEHVVVRETVARRVEPLDLRASPFRAPRAPPPQANQAFAQATRAEARPLQPRLGGSRTTHRAFLPGVARGVLGDAPGDARLLARVADGRRLPVAHAEDVGER